MLTRAFLMAALWAAFLLPAQAADTWEPRVVQPFLYRCLTWDSFLEGLAKNGESVRASYRDDAGNDWLVFSNHETGTWSVLVMPPHMASSKGLCLHGYGGGLIKSKRT